MKKSVVIGSSGQDGTYLCQYLIDQGNTVIKIARRSELSDYVLNLASYDEVKDFIIKFKPDEIYYLAAHHISSQQNKVQDVKFISDNHNINYLAPMYILEAIRQFSVTTKLFYASSSHIFGVGTKPIYNEETLRNPICFYGLHKTNFMNLAKLYRDQYNIFCVCGILFNHESVLRSSSFLSKKIIETAHRISKGSDEILTIGQLDQRTDWGYAPDYVKGMHLTLQQSKAENYIFSSGELHSVQDFIDVVFEYFKIDQKNRIISTPQIIAQNRGTLLGDSSKLKSIGWLPSLTFKEWIYEICSAYEKQ